MMADTARSLAVRLLLRTFTAGGYSNLLLDQALDASDLNAADKRLCAMLYYGVTERLLTLEHVAGCYTSRPVSKLDREVRFILYLGLYQLLYCEKIPDRAAVSETVALTGVFRKKSASGFVNAVLRSFLREHTYGLKPRNYLLALHDDATDLEAHALSELLIACGAKETLMEYRAFLLSSAERFIAVTGSKRAVTVTMVLNDQDDTERMFIPVNEAGFDAVMDAIHTLDPDETLPVYRFGVGEELQSIGKPAHAGDLVRNFVKML